jgi:hypothetical protein
MMIWQEKSSTYRRALFLVELILKNWHQIEPELGRWRDMLAVPWNRYKQLYTPGVT